MSIGERLDEVGTVWIISEVGEHALAGILCGRGIMNVSNVAPRSLISARSS